MACGRKSNQTSAMMTQLWLYVKKTTDLTASSLPMGRTRFRSPAQTV